MDGSLISSSSTNALIRGMKLIMEYSENCLRIYTQDRQVNLTANVVAQEYYLYFILYYEESSIIVSRLQ